MQADVKSDDRAIGRGRTCESPYLPGREAGERSALVICNGGSMTTQQSLAAGVPVIGIAGNLDQHLNMQALERTRSGERLHVSRVWADEVRRTFAEELLLGLRV